MVSNELYEAVFDTILKHAFLDAFRCELDNLYIDNNSNNYPTKKHKKATRRTFKLKMRKQTGIFKYTRHAASML